ncbi:hypothetical protein GXN76_05720 [Kroppenstedtia pulmonis]|uniref:Uncharacterized protein n=1 Tax=Kroppenstedtia pulmonis TaxID=1380685 RepID=A0A7D4CV57_9BACL|nr:hypothetical protein [Kroppenstedtia pulmonis]QKG84017.1 hypothetical protein GXN76_05720 [Kroppenstedtia pulmonis]
MFSNRWPRFSLYTPLSMGIIHPEYLYMYHHLNEEDSDDTQEEALRPSPPSSDDNPPTNFRKIPSPRIRIRSRPEI